MNIIYLYYSLFFLFLSSFFEILFSSYTLTGEAGISRLLEKYSDLSKRLVYWKTRWLRLHATLLTLSVITKITSVGCCILFLRQLLIMEQVYTGFFLIITFCLFFILFLKLLPKVISESYADRISISTLWLTAPLTIFLFFINLPVAYLEKFLMRRFTARSDEDDRPSTEDEILSLVDQSAKEELIKEEREIIKSVFDFGDTVTREIMTPRVDILGIEDTLNIKEAIHQLKDTPHSRFPVYHESIDDICGIIHVKDLLKSSSEEKGDKKIISLLQSKSKTTFVPESMPIPDLLQLLKNAQAQLAIVVDEYGGTAGMVTIEDILEELVGEIEDEYDTQKRKIHELSDGAMIVDARLPVDEINELLDIQIPEREEYDSIGGYIFHKLGRIPLAGEKLENSGYQITIQSASPSQLRKLRITKLVKKQ